MITSRPPRTLPAVVPGKSFKALAMGLLLPLLLLNVTVANQLWAIGPLYISQPLLFWPAIACVFIIVLLSWRGRLWPLGLLLGVIAARMMGANESEGWPYFLYAVPLHAAFLLAGSIVALERRELLFRQLRFYFALTVPFMLLQVAGAGDWTLALNTQTTGVPEQQIANARVTQPTLFVPESQLEGIAIGQARPAGFMHANAILSFIIMVALAMQLGRAQTRLTRTDVLFCAAMVLAMAKIVMLGFAVMVTYQWLTRTHPVRRRMRRVLTLTALLYAIYAVVFPGLFLHHFNLPHVSYGVYTRLNDFLGTMPADNPVVQVLKPQLEDTPTLIVDDGVSRLSGYSMISRVVPFLILVAPIAFLVLRPCFRTLRLRSPEYADSALLVLLVTLLLPLATPYWGSPLYWFVLGIGFMPVVWFYSHPLRSLRPVPRSRSSARRIPVRSRPDLQQ